METLFTTDIAQAAALLREGSLVAFPTETVYGLGANAWDADAVASIFAAKGRPADNPLIVHVATVADCLPLVAAMPEMALTLFEAFAPGPISLILPRHPDVAPIVSGGLETLALRIPAHPMAQALIRTAGCPVAAPSANRSGRPSPTTWEAVAEDLDGRIACILQGEPAEVGLESTVVDVTGPFPIVLRSGAVSLEALREVVPETQLYTASTTTSPRSPGLKYRHYAPRARVALTEHVRDIARPTNDQRLAFIGRTPPSEQHLFAMVATCTDVQDYSQRLFAFFRACDRAQIDRIYCEEVPDTGLGRALMDRIRRAATSTN